MKKFFTIVACLMMVIGVGLGFAGCENNAIVSIEVKEGSIPTEVYQNEELDLSRASLVVNLLGERRLEIMKTDINNIVFGAADTSTLGEKTLEITYAGFKTEHKYTVIINPANVTSFTVKEGTLNTAISIAIGSDALDFSNVVLVANLSDGSTVELDASYFTFSGIDTELEGAQTLTITLKAKPEVSIDVEVEVSLDYQIVGYSQPANIRTYNQNILPQANEDNEFTVRDDGYYVGDDNAFVYKPIITAVSAGLDYDVTAYDMSVKVEQLGADSNYVELSGADLEALVTISADEGTFDFTDLAIGNTFRLTVWPAEDESYTCSLVVKVVDAWNVYNAADFSRLDNYNNTAWSEYKTANGIGNESINGLVLHNNITLTADDIPEDYLFTADDADVVSTDKDYGVVIGSLRDRKSIYVRQISYEESFTFIGNYFNVDASNLPFIIRDDDDASKTTFTHYDENGQPVFDNAIVPNSRLISFGGDSRNSPEEAQGYATLKNVSILGNCPREGDLRYTGGLGFVGTSSRELFVDNVITRAFSTHYASLHMDQKMTMVDCKGFDAFSAMFFLWKSQGNSMTNCVFKDAGGPLISLAHVDPEVNAEQYSSILVKDCVLESFVSPNDPWFKMYEATPIATDMLSLNDLFTLAAAGLNQAGMTVPNKSFVRNDNGVEKINFLFLVQDGNNPLTCPAKIGGNLTVMEGEETVHSLDMQDSTFLTDTTYVGNLLPFFKTYSSDFFTVTVGGDAKPNGFGKVDGPGDVNGAVDASYTKLFEGDYLNIYAPVGTSSYVGVVLGYDTVS